MHSKTSSKSVATFLYFRKCFRKFLSVTRILICRFATTMLLLWPCMQCMQPACTVWFLICIVLIIDAFSSSSKRKDDEVCEVSSWTFEANHVYINDISYFVSLHRHIVLIIYLTHVVVHVSQTLVLGHGCYIIHSYSFLLL